MLATHAFAATHVLKHQSLTVQLTSLGAEAVFAFIWGPNQEIQNNHIRGCALSRSTDGLFCNEGRVVESLSSSMASPANVASVFVGDTGDCGVFSSMKVSPVMARGGAICKAR